MEIRVVRSEPGRWLKAVFYDRRHDHAIVSFTTPAGRQLIPQAPKDKISMRIRQPHWDQVTAAWGSHRYDRNPGRFSEID